LGGQPKDLGHELEVLAEQFLQLICPTNVSLKKNRKNNFLKKKISNHLFSVRKKVHTYPNNFD